MMLYSQSTGGFYIQGRHRDIPPDAIEITEAEYAAMKQTGADQEIVLGENGRPEKRDRQVSPGQARKNRESMVRHRIETVARNQFGFESIIEAVSYAGEYANLQRQTNGLNLRVWRSQCWGVFDAAMVNNPNITPQALLNLLPSPPDPV